MGANGYFVLALRNPSWPCFIIKWAHTEWSQIGQDLVRNSQVEEIQKEGMPPNGREGQVAIKQAIGVGRGWMAFLPEC